MLKYQFIVKPYAEYQDVVKSLLPGSSKLLDFAEKGVGMIAD